MPGKHTVTFYPVGNGDSSQIVLSNGKRILMDYRHQQAGEDDTSPVIDLAKQLRSELDDANRDYFDVVAFTHADNDHIAGSTDFFELRHASKYQGKDRIKIAELWVPAAMLLDKATQDQLSNEFVILRKEAWHRLVEGKGILVFSKPDDLKKKLDEKLKEKGLSSTARDHLFVDAGTLVPGFDLSTDGVEFFCHSPFKQHCEDGDIVRNSASLIFNVRMLIDGVQNDYLAVGDTEWEDLEEIVRITQYHSNDDRLNWDLFNVPHHCSYLALSDDKGEYETTPKPKVKTLLEHGQPDAYMVSSSLPIGNDKEAREQTLPPHVQAQTAYKRYLRNCGGRKFLVTMEEPNKTKPKPLVFEFSGSGKSWKKTTVIGAPAIMSSAPPRAGNDN